MASRVEHGPGTKPGGLWDGKMLLVAPDAVGALANASSGDGVIESGSDYPGDSPLRAYRNASEQEALPLR
jgi:hypothetical protein